ncbi:MAG TPA: tetratricopeptide repeat protein [Polyangia bacterium]|nr:tetratricopeptide repeat protein [Polyangia bacterium]
MFDRSKARVAQAIIGAVVLSSAAALAGPVYKKKETEIKATQTERTAPPKPKASEKPAPTLKQEQFVAGIQTKIENINEAMIAKMQRLIAITPDTDPEKPDFIFRLAELYNEKRQYNNFRARALDEKIFQSRSEGEKMRMKSEQGTFEREEKRWLLEAAKTYITVATNPKFASYPRMDEVLFYLGYMLQQVKREDEARVFFLRLVKDFPNSRFVPDAYLSFGEYYFTAGDMDAAMKFYDKVTKFPQSKVFGYALYKKGWAFYNLKEFNRSMETFITVITLAQQGKLDKANRAGLEKECKKDTVLVYSQIGTPEKAWNFFQRVGGSYAPKMEERLAELYWEHGQFSDSIKVYHELMRLFPDDPKLCEWEYNVVKNTLSVGNKPAQVQEMQRLSAVFERYKKGQQKEVKQNLVEECRNNTVDTLHELAVVWHKEAQKTRNPETYALAQYIYKEYIDRFPQEKDAYTMNWYYGELLFTLGTEEKDTAKQRWYYEKAADQYTKVVKMKPGGEYLKDAAYAAVLSYNNANAAAPDRPEAKVDTVKELTQDCSTTASEAETTAKKKGGKKKEKGSKEKEGCAEADKLKQYPAKTIPPDKQKMLDAFDLYLSQVKNANENDDQMIRIKYQRARVYYEYNHFDKAAPLFADLADKHAKHELGIIAANLLLDCLNIQGKYDALMKTLDRFLQNPDLMRDQQFSADLRRIKAESKWKRADRLFAQKHWREAANMYVEVFNDASDAPRAAQALFNAGIAFDNARLIGQAIKMRQNLIKLKPNSTEAQKAFYQIGENYHGIAYYQRAAESYEAFAAKYPGEKESADALSNATFFRRGLGDDEKAIADNNLYIKFYGQRKPAEAARVFFSIGAIYEKEKKWDALIRHLQEFLNKYGSKAPDLQVVAHAQMGLILWRQSCPLQDTQLGACIKIERVRAGGAASALAKIAKGKKIKIKGKAQCGPETKSHITVAKRGESKAHEAQRHFAQALSLYKSHGKGVAGGTEAERAARIEVMSDAVAHARFMQAEEVYEKLLALPFPNDLVFSDNPKLKRKNEESKKKFDAWLKDKGKVLEQARAIYLNVLEFKQANWSIAASARIGQLYQNFADGLFTAPIPSPSDLVSKLEKAGYKKDDIQEAVDTFRDKYCDTLQDQADPLEAKAIEGLGKCLEKSTELSWYNEWSGLCEQELNQIKPNEYPMAAELRAEPGYAATRVDEGILIEDVE